MKNLVDNTLIWLDKILNWAHFVIPLIFVVIVLLVGRFACNAGSIQNADSPIEEPAVLNQVQETSEPIILSK